MDTLTERMRQLQSAGWIHEITFDAGWLTCRKCGEWASPEDVAISKSYRFEGTSDPGDEAILFAIIMPCDHHGLLTAAYGHDAPPEVADIVTRLHLGNP
ncbi:unannotated protein [freshwater metagenome]|uniref:Unannotated protein n=1 Tax=freshwater metagenome TaxID=449393 RepID=A0A6J7F674_9ZZZZ